MLSKNPMIRIHMCDDDPDDQLLVSDALLEARLANTIDFTSNGEELLRYLRREDEFSHLSSQALPGIILLDLNMPIMDGREVIKIIKSDDNLKHIPIVVLTTSKAEEDIARTYDMGINSFVVKPVSFEKLVEMILSLTDYWFNVVALPNTK